MLKKLIVITVSIITAFAGVLGPAGYYVIGEQTGNLSSSINLSKSAIENGYTVNGFDDKLKLSLTKGTLLDATQVELMQLNEFVRVPWEFKRVSEVYQFEFKNKQAYDNHKPFYIQLSYDKEDNNYKQVFFYDKVSGLWKSLPTQDFPDKKFVRSLIHLPYARLVIFSHNDILTAGKASWYTTSKKGNYTASPDFPLGSRLRIYAYDDSNKFVDVEVITYGPDRKVHPDRVVDLNKEAFSKLISPSEGTLRVSVEPLYIAGELGKRVNGYTKGAKYQPEISSRAAYIMEEGTGRTIFEKSATSTLPLASLTKIIAASTFLDLHPGIDEVVAYKKADEKLNYLYCNEWESGKLALAEGETLTVKDLIYSSLVGSTNNTVETLVRVSGLSREEFIKKMNEKVKAWGAQSTRFIEPTGLAPENVSSVKDYAIIMKEALKNKIVQEASATSLYKFATLNEKKAHAIKNTNILVRQDKYEITGSKTGYLDEALYCLATRTKAANGEQVIVVTMGTDTRDKSFSEGEELIRYGLSRAFLD